VRLRRESFPSREAARAAEARLGPAGRLDPATAETIGPAPAASLPPSVLPEALRLRRPGDRTLVEREGDVALVELVEVIPAAPQPFEAVRDRVERSLRTLRGQEAFHQLLEGLRDGAEVEIDAALLSQDAMWVAGDDEPQSGS